MKFIHRRVRFQVNRGYPADKDSKDHKVPLAYQDLRASKVLLADLGQWAGRDNRDKMAYLV